MIFLTVMIDEYTKKNIATDKQAKKALKDEETKYNEETMLYKLFDEINLQVKYD